MKIRKRYVCLCAALLVGGVFWHASLYRPTGPADGVDVQGADFTNRHDNVDPTDNNSQPSVAIDVTNNKKSANIRLGSFNIHGCEGLDGKYDVDRVAKCLEGLDFVSLNEVKGASLFKNQDQAELLGRRLGMAWLFAPSVRQWYWMESGNGLLTRIPIVAWHRIPLVQRMDYSYRNAVCVDLLQKSGARNRVIHVLLTHLNRRYDSEREAQFKEVISLFLALAEPAVLLGDLNSTAQDAQIRQLKSLSGVIDAVGRILGPKDPERIDWIFVRGLKCVDAGVLENDASDHPLVWAELE
jgi:endonuclease/exonuclease/phosphatase family metal-dependent hydrolase